MSEKIKIYRSNTQDYHDAFQVFLEHTNQKAKAREWLERRIAKLPSRKTFIDAGAGNGKVTAWFTDSFDQTIATEPNESLRKELQSACPKAQIYGDTILDAPIEGPADFVLSSHVFYYIPAAEWLKNLDRIASWLAPGGEAAVVIQNHETDCMKMLRHFLKQSFDLRPTAEIFKKNTRGKYKVEIETISAQIKTAAFENALTIAEFMLNLLPLQDAPLRREVEEYVQTNFTAKDGGFCFSCNQDFLKIQLT